MAQNDDHPLYRAILRLYPKNHRQEYGGQMLQTFDDLLAERDGAFKRFAIWLRVGLELPRNLIEEHVNDIRGKNMPFTTKKTMLGAGAVAVIALAVGAGLVLTHQKPYTPTRLADVPRSAKPPACLLGTDVSKLAAKSKDEASIDDTVTGSIIDIPAGTYVDTYIKSYNGNQASGTAVYPSKYGSYNFVAKKTPGAAGGSTGWLVTHFEACKK